MAEIKVLGSSSKGNCYIVECSEESLILEAGVDIREVNVALDFDYSRVSGCLVTHEHGDHCKYAEKLAKKHVDIFSSAGTLKTLGLYTKGRSLSYASPTQIGGFNVKMIKNTHEGAEPVSFLITHKEVGSMLFVTDTGSFPYKISGVNYIMIEANYAFDTITESGEAWSDRIFPSHLSLEAALNACELHRDTLDGAMLTHLSERNADRDIFEDRAKERLGIPVSIGRKGLIATVGMADQEF